MDVDGTMTDGGIIIDEDGREIKRFDVRDGYGIAALRRSGVEVAIISGRPSKCVRHRAKELGISRVELEIKDKLPVMKAIAEELGISQEECAFIGDDIPDLECVEWCGLGIAVADADPALASAADWIAPRRGGHGAIRDAADHILRINSTI